MGGCCNQQDGPGDLPKVMNEQVRRQRKERGSQGISGDSFLGSHRIPRGRRWEEVQDVHRGARDLCCCSSHSRASAGGVEARSRQALKGPGGQAE